MSSDVAAFCASFFAFFDMDGAELCARAGHGTFKSQNMLTRVIFAP